MMQITAATTKIIAAARERLILEVKEPATAGKPVAAHLLKVNWLQFSLASSCPLAANKKL